MGSDSSKTQSPGEKSPPEARMKHKAEVVKKFARRPDATLKQHEASIVKMAKQLATLMQQNDNVGGTPKDKKQIEIEGVTYEITQFVNRGGFGEIYKARPQNNNRTVAIKIMENTPGILEEIKNEISFLRLTKNIELEYPPVIEYYGCKFNKEGIFIAMELASCDLLTFWFKQVAEREAQEKFIFGIIIIVYVLRALIFLEKLNIIHGDIKPQNLVVVPENQRFYIKLIDFGTVEKMNTVRAQLTVDAGKAHTLFFASPEFLRRDSNNMMARHLHKKSDAWAAGVMFYILFFEKLPWADQYDYENFCNNPRARDIFVPHEGGYKLIIELLLKKNPRDRSSAKATYKQLRSHPALGTIVESLQQNFCAVDDVCNMTIPDSVQRELGKKHARVHI